MGNCLKSNNDKPPPSTAYRKSTYPGYSNRQTHSRFSLFDKCRRNKHTSKHNLTPIRDFEYDPERDKLLLEIEEPERR
jgi:hypothetical protein